MAADVEGAVGTGRYTDETCHTAGPSDSAIKTIIGIIGKDTVDAVMSNN